MAIPSVFTFDMLKEMQESIERLSNDSMMHKSLLVSPRMADELAKHFKHERKPSERSPYDNFAGFTTSYAGFPVETFDIPPEITYDWSDCRSPSRAKRRHARGIPQRVKVIKSERAFLISRGVDALARRFEDSVVKLLYGDLEI